MYYAKDANDKRIAPTPSTRALCPLCSGEVTSKCGKIVTWHWAHLNLDDCDKWAEPESDWHKEWKEKYPEEMREVVIGNHRADIVTENKEVIELQNSNISPDEIGNRERFYKNMAWIFNAIDCRQRIALSPCTGKDGKPYFRFKWLRPKKHIAYTTKPTFLDLGDKMLLIKRMRKDTPCYGWGYVFDAKDFVKIKRFAGVWKIQKNMI